MIAVTGSASGIGAATVERLATIAEESELLRVLALGASVRAARKVSAGRATTCSSSPTSTERFTSGQPPGPPQSHLSAPPTAKSGIASYADSAANNTYNIKGYGRAAPLTPVCATAP